MGRWRAASHLLARVANSSPKPRFFSAVSSRHLPLPPPPGPAPSRLSIFASSILARPLSAVAARAYFDGDELGPRLQDSGRPCLSPIKDADESDNIPIKSYFLSTSIDLKSLQAENLGNVLPATSRSSNYIALKYSALPSDIRGLGAKERASHCHYMVVCQYGSVILFNIEDDEIETYLKIVRRHASGLLPQRCKDDYVVKEQPLLDGDMEGGPDYIVLKVLDIDGIRIIGSVLGQSIALDYFVSQIDGMVEEFAYINRKMETTGTFTMDRKKLLQLVGKANSNLADVILKVGLFERSEIAWREAKYAQIYEYLREEYEVTQRFGNLNFKLKFVEHNIHFLHEVLQNNRSNLLEWCIIFLLSIENVISLYEILKDSIQVPL
ncbi:protein RETARDED ROOT GROWTH, mitochondrial [Rhodamnia argentea]|uniref:Protein RETARDED ROOT GROWTH, mitochondrial n=1 Tax=Rhodamnia argentea TaxID=178133 RepID=A0A8B8R2D9_9MYRT|nr:protein RETARDED ROOT GROWTH, mitochondrial [Rhodamnia argentea]